MVSPPQVGQDVLVPATRSEVLSPSTGCVEPIASSESGDSVADVIAAMAKRRFTGLVHVGDDGELWFDDGRIYLANGPSSPSLFDVLLSAGVGGPGLLEAVCAEADRGGDAVVDRLSGDEQVAIRLRRLLHEHVLAALFELVVPSASRIEYEPGVRHVLGSRFAEPAEDLVATTQQRMELWRRVAERIPSTSIRFRLARSLPGGTERLITPDEWSFLALLDGRHTVAEVITESGDSAFRVCSALYRMLLEEMIEPVPGD